MKTLSCGDLGVSSCAFTAKGATEQDVIETMMKHGMEHHKEMMDKMSDEDKMKMKEDMSAKMKDE
jgi:predicted small metal-binding protein